MWRLTDLAAAEIAALEEDGVKVTPQAVLYIQQLSLDVVSPVDGVSLSRGDSVSVGGVTLWPLTIAAHWYFTQIEAIPRLSPRFRVMALAYAMAHAHDPKAVGVEPDLRSIRVWARRLTCRFEDLADAVNDVFGDGARPYEDKPDDPKDERRTVAALSQQAVALCGGSPEYWEYQVSYRYVAELIARAVRLKAALGGAEKLDATTDALRRLAIFVETYRKEAKKNG